MIPPAANSAWVIGGAGFLGSALAERYRAAGQRVLVVDPAGEPGELTLRAAADAPGVLVHAAELLVPQVIFFCAATRGGDAAAYRRTYVEPVLRAVEAAPQAHLVFCSSSAVYGGSGAVTEQSPTPGETARQQALLEGESAVLRAGGAVARLVALYGPGRCELLRRHLAGEPRLPGAPDRVLNYVHVQDAACALALLAGGSGVYNVCAESFTKAEVYAMLEAVTGIPQSPRDAAATERRGTADHRVSAELLRAVTAWAPQLSFRSFVASSLHS